jgi:CRP-like cAMP-binding protein
MKRPHFSLEESLSAKEMEVLKNSVSEHRLRKGDRLFFEGKTATGVYYVATGKFKLYTTDAGGREQIIHLGRPGDMMGYRAVLGSDTYSCTAEALESSEVWFIPKNDFLLLLDSNASLSHAVIRLLTEELRHAEHHLAGLARKTVKARLADALILLVDKFGYEDDGQTLAVGLTREELAALVGTVTETAIRLIQQLKEEGLLATDGKKIRLLDEKALRHYSDDLPR